MPQLYQPWWIKYFPSRNWTRCHANEIGNLTPTQKWRCWPPTQDLQRPPAASGGHPVACHEPTWTSTAQVRWQVLPLTSVGIPRQHADTPTIQIWPLDATPMTGQLIHHGTFVKFTRHHKEWTSPSATLSLISQHDYSGRHLHQQWIKYMCMGIDRPRPTMNTKLHIPQSILPFETSLDHMDMSPPLMLLPWISHETFWTSRPMV